MRHHRSGVALIPGLQSITVEAMPGFPGGRFAIALAVIAGPDGVLHHVSALIVRGPSTTPITRP